MHQAKRWAALLLAIAFMQAPCWVLARQLSAGWYFALIPLWLVPSGWLLARAYRYFHQPPNAAP